MTFLCNPFVSGLFSALAVPSYLTYKLYHLEALEYQKRLVRQECVSTALARQQRIDRATNSPLRRFVLLNHIQAPLWRYELTQSPMRNFVTKRCGDSAIRMSAALLLLQSYVNDLRKLQDVSLSHLAPLGRLASQRCISDLVARWVERGEYKRVSRSRVIHELHTTGYTDVYRNVCLRRYCLEHQIAEAQISSGSHNVFCIVFNDDLGRQKDNQDNEEGLRKIDVDLAMTGTIYYSPTDVTTYGYLMAPAALSNNSSSRNSKNSKNNTDDSIRLAETYKNMAPQRAQVWVLTDNDRIQVHLPRAAVHFTQIAFVRRDKEEFDLETYNECASAVKAACISVAGISFQLGFARHWLSNELIVTLELPYTNDRVRLRSLYMHVIQRVNLVKGVIFARIADQVRWLCV